MSTNMIAKLDDLIATVKAEADANVKELEATKAKLLGKTPETNGNGHNGHAKGKKGLKPSLKLTLKTKGAKVDKKEIVKLITKAERLSTGKIAAAIGLDVDAANTALTKISEIEYHARGRGGYWTLADEAADA